MSLINSPFVRPIDEGERVPDVLRIFRHIEANPGKTIREIADALQIQELSARMAVARMSHDGKIRAMQKSDGRRKRWEVGCDESREPRSNSAAVPKRSSVKKWEPNHMRHWMDVALFGPAKQPQQPQLEETENE